jgi:hypothetical protein
MLLFIFFWLLCALFALGWRLGYEDRALDRLEWAVVVSGPLGLAFLFGMLLGDHLRA